MTRTTFLTILIVAVWAVAGLACADLFGGSAIEGRWDFVEMLSDEAGMVMCSDTGSFRISKTARELVGDFHQVGACTVGSVTIDISHHFPIPEGAEQDGDVRFTKIDTLDVLPELNCTYRLSKKDGLEGTVECFRFSGTFRARPASGRTRSVSIMPDPATVLVGGQVHLVAETRESDGQRVFRQAIWRSETPGVATVDPSGLVTGLALGTALIRAQAGGRVDDLTVTVALTEYESIHAGLGYTCALTATGEALCWGSNHGGRLGDGSPGARTGPTFVRTAERFVELSPRDFTCARTEAGVASCWGANPGGRLGNGTLLGTSKPTRVQGPRSFASVVAGYGHGCGIATDGVAYCWGENEYGQLGDGTTTSREQPTAVVGALTFAAIAAGWRHTCGLATDGTAYCWGRNEFGELGDGTTIDRATPTPVQGGLQFESLVVGGLHSCGIAAGGIASCWGFNRWGQLGDGTTEHRATPVGVAGGFSFSSLSAGDQHTCAIRVDAVAYCWGANFFGEIGDNSTTMRTAPTQVSGDIRFRAVSAGLSHSCGMSVDGLAYCWGWNEFGQLGNGNTVARSTPMRVVGQ